jgi:hypothetical protein
MRRIRKILRVKFFRNLDGVTVLMRRSRDVSIDPLPQASKGKIRRNQSPDFLGFNIFEPASTEDVSLFIIRIGVLLASYA